MELGFFTVLSFFYKVLFITITLLVALFSASAPIVLWYIREKWYYVFLYLIVPLIWALCYKLLWLI